MIIGILYYALGAYIYALSVFCHQQGVELKANKFNESAKRFSQASFIGNTFVLFLAIGSIPIFKWYSIIGIVFMAGFAMLIFMAFTKPYKSGWLFWLFFRSTILYQLYAFILIYVIVCIFRFLIWIYN